ncbi:MAG: T9SS type A sorting domain-containing protein [Bacteroidota bacterium]
MRKAFLTGLVLSYLFALQVSAQTTIRNFIFGHSLINHEFQVNPTPSQETSVPHWFHFLAEEAGVSYAVSGQYGFLPQHQNLPPISQWGFDVVAPVWESDTEPFSAADFTDILITPGNFIQWQGPDQEYPADPGITPLSATQRVFEWCDGQEEGLNFYVYENWPDMAPFLSNGFPPSASEWKAYNSELNGPFHSWFLTYHDALVAANPDLCISMIPVGPVLSTILTQEPFNQIPITDLFEDDAPHGRASLYFLAAMTTYSAMVGEPVPAGYSPPSIINSIIRENYETAGTIIWESLNDFTDGKGNLKAFCQNLNTSTELEEALSPTTIYPNPASNELFVRTGYTNLHFQLRNMLGQEMRFEVRLAGDRHRLDLQALPMGMYQLTAQDSEGKLILSGKVIKRF